MLTNPGVGRSAFTNKLITTMQNYILEYDEVNFTNITMFVMLVDENDIRLGSALVNGTKLLTCSFDGC
jgi:hypothetical protein